MRKRCAPAPQPFGTFIIFRKTHMSVNVESVAAESAAQRSGEQQSAWNRVAMPLILTLVSIGIMMYPVVVTQLKNLEQMRVSQEFSQQEEKTDVSELEQKYQSALAYNKNRAQGPILDPWLARITEDNTDYQAYLAELNTYEVMGRIVIPSINVDLPIYHGTGEDSLQRGVGHLYGSDLPVGGEGTHSILTSHTGLRNATLFDNLIDLKEGDSFYVGVSGERLKYKVFKTEVVLPNETESLRQEPGKDIITLITCTPYGINSHRLLVHAERVPMDEQEETTVFATPSTLNWQWWMFALMGASLALLIGMGFWARNVFRKTRSEENENIDMDETL